MIPPCAEWWCETDNQATTPFGNCLFLSVRSHCVNARWKRCQEDLNSFPFEVQVTSWTSSCYVDEDYPARPEIQKPLPERCNWRGSESSTLETDVYVLRYTLLAVRVENEWMSDYFSGPMILSYRPGHCKKQGLIDWLIDWYKMSHRYPILHGVPQCSLLVLLLYILYIAEDVASILPTDTVSFYADDAQL